MKNRYFFEKCFFFLYIKLDWLTQFEVIIPLYNFKKNDEEECEEKKKIIHSYRILSLEKWHLKWKKKKKEKQLSRVDQKF